MPTFGELLNFYMTRTGISDSELARTVGVSRQTVFRWKEQLVARPRHRDDVLACARRLRLTPEEADQLLLAAGFAPENATGFGATATAAPGGGSGSGTGNDTDKDSDSDSDTDTDTEILADDTRTTYSRRWLFGGLAATGLLALGFAAWATLGRPTPTALPVARSGESLVLVAS